jgi:excisionase family DNA binding protein
MSGMTVKEAAEKLEVSASLVYPLVDDGRAQAARQNRDLLTPARPRPPYQDSQPQ